MSLKPFKPMLAEDFDLKHLRFPLLCSPKIDGIRCVIRDGQPLTRKLLPIPNNFVRGALTRDDITFLDGELTVGAANDPDVYNKTQKGVMAAEPKDLAHRHYIYHVFDSTEYQEDPYKERLGAVGLAVMSAVTYYEDSASVLEIRILPQKLVISQEELDAYEAECLAQGYEGVIARDPEGKYKYGRSTARECGMLKVKRRVDAEAKVVGFKEEMHNANEAHRAEVGQLKRSSSQAGLVGKGILGALECVTEDGQTFSVSGFKAKDKEDLWKIKDQLIGKWVKFKHFPIGAKDAPRNPSFLGFRDPSDM